MREKFSSFQRSTLLLCFFAYASAYTGRLNLSAALPGLRGSIAISDVQAGLFQTVFALVYAAGQIINGLLADKINVRLSIAAGLAASAVCNALFGLNSSFALLLALWGLNGAAQSMALDADREACRRTLQRPCARPCIICALHHCDLRTFYCLGNIRYSCLCPELAVLFPDPCLYNGHCRSYRLCRSALRTGLRGR